MAVEMVRKPSETPNIENIDDFMPIRYAYSNQNGYVIGYGGLGTELDADAYSINGNYFIINSGRLVLQGVETDIKNEHTIVIDINATKRYYAVYLQVNLATNTSEVLVTYDTAGIPNVNTGDNLTTNSVGTARMVLFTFEATNGNITNVVKVVRPCKYSLPYDIDDKGVLRVGNTIIPQRKVLWSNDSGATSASWLDGLSAGDAVEVTYSLWNNRQVVKGVLYLNSASNPTTELYVRADYGYFTTTNAYQTAVIDVSSNSAKITRLAYGNHAYPDEPKIYKVVKVIE